MSVILNYDESKIAYKFEIRIVIFVKFWYQRDNVGYDIILFQRPPSITNPHKMFFNLVYTYFICQLNGLHTS